LFVTVTDNGAFYILSLCGTIEMAIYVIYNKRDGNGALFFGEKDKDVYLK
jgi:hypothetical protein